MHICHVNLASGFAGGERQTVNLIRYLADHGCEQTLVAKPGNPMIEEVRGLPVNVRTASHFTVGHSRGNWDLIHCHDGKAVYWGLLESLLRKTPYIVTRRVENPLKDKKVTHAAYGRAESVVCLSRAVRNVVQGLLPEIDCTVIPSSFSGFPADALAVADIRSRYKGKLIVGQIGSLLRIKGYHVTIEAARILERQRSDLMFVFLGKGPELVSLIRQAQGMGAVEFIGHQKDVGNWLAAMDILVFPSLQEGLGSTILEAMQHGTPVIGSKVGGIPDIIENGRNGLLVPPEDAEALASAILNLANNPAQRQQYAKQAKLDLVKFSPETVGKAYLDLYRQTL
ncbi:glycosyl transferase [Streptosporangium jomthongense]|uniref:Glycosyltransferase family 4 protein n=1 Tax=Marinobacter aromaticivorans TaxID=1494078 RepID=A0ABW2IYG5_9GAMM|nr:glycosyltransferase family 4 protein [Marinobacter aromaticivorans]GGE74687.1 glycosyl transferase [Streptosporangium jomthongense]